MELRNENGVNILSMPPKIDVLMAPEIEKKLLELVEANLTPLACDFAECNYISSAGLRVLLVTSKKMKVKNADFYLFGMKPEVFSSFRLAGFDQIMNIKN